MKQWKCFAYEGLGVLWSRLWRWLVAHIGVTVILSAIFGNSGFDLLVSPLMSIIALVAGPIVIVNVILPCYCNWPFIVLFYLAYLLLLCGYLFSIKLIARILLLAALLVIAAASTFLFYCLIWASC